MLGTDENYPGFWISFGDDWGEGSGGDSGGSDYDSGGGDFGGGGSDSSGGGDGGD
ncbi:MAG: hypothetical protein KDK36_17705 [Leptospiraceae bacterium]|nr:hypothetical protein [Leptospiraceae bacterium]